MEKANPVDVQRRIEERNAELEKVNRALQAEIAELKRTNEQLRHARKVEAVGRLAAGIAHAFNNLLTAINGYADLLVQRMEPADPMCREIEGIREAGEQAASLTRKLLAFSRRQILHPGVIDLNEVLSRIDQSLHHLIGEDLTLRISAGENLWRIKADPEQIEQVLMNLAANARDAMSAGGVLTIATANAGLSTEIQLDSGAIPPGEYVTLLVSDTGCGMDAPTMSRLFEPFFTTKEKGKATGLGLAMVYGIVKQSGGYIHVESAVGEGTSFRIYLPRTKEKGPAEKGETGKVLTGGRERVLVVEDQEEVRSLVEEILRMRGYSVLTASSGDEALRLARATRKPIHLLLTDMMMPGMSGRELAGRMQRIVPTLKVIIMSGYAEDESIQWSTIIQGMEFLQKPFSVDALTSKVRKVLDG